jgi:hypothetical protein
MKRLPINIRGVLISNRFKIIERAVAIQNSIVILINSDMERSAILRFYFHNQGRDCHLKGGIRIFTMNKITWRER